MTLSMYQASVPPCVQALTALKGVLAKAANHAAERKIEPSVLLGSRLSPDMFALTRQVQIATDGAKGGCARLAGETAPSYADTESSFAELEARIEKTLGYLGGLAPAAIDGSEERRISLKLGGQEVAFAGQPYLLQFVLPNLYFHVATAYDILRHNGVSLGKRDFLGSLTTL